MKHGLAGIDERAVVVVRQAKTLFSQITAEDADARINALKKFRKIEMQLQRLQRRRRASWSDFARTRRFSFSPCRVSNPATR